MKASAALASVFAFSERSERFIRSAKINKQTGANASIMTAWRKFSYWRGEKSRKFITAKTRRTALEEGFVRRRIRYSPTEPAQTRANVTAIPIRTSQPAGR